MGQVNRDRTDFDRSFLAPRRAISEVSKVGSRITSKLSTSHRAAWW